MWLDLLTSEDAARCAQHQVTRRAETYSECGLPLDSVLDALEVSRATWYRRLEALRAWEAENQAAGKHPEEVAKRRAKHRRTSGIGRAPGAKGTPAP